MTTVVYPALNPAALPTMVRTARGTITHQHAGPGGSLKDIVDTFDAKSTAFLVVSGADLVGNTLSLRPCHVIQVVRVFW